MMIKLLNLLTEKEKTSWEKFITLNHFLLIRTIKYEFFDDSLVILYFSSKEEMMKFSSIHKLILKNIQFCFETRIIHHKKQRTSGEKKFYYLIKKYPKLKILKECLYLDFSD
ncbi:MAG: hypothetical protein ACFIN1_00290 [Candidatus Walczuchella monophlebidarum]